MTEALSQLCDAFGGDWARLSLIPGIDLANPATHYEARAEAEPRWTVGRPTDLGRALHGTLRMDGVTVGALSVGLPEARGAGPVATSAHLLDVVAPAFARILQSRALAQDAVAQDPVLYRTLSQLEAFDERINGRTDHSPESIAGFALDALAAVWPGNRVAGLSVVYRTGPGDAETVLRHGEPAGEATDRALLPKKGTISGELCVFSVGAGKLPESATVLRLFADRLSVTLALVRMIADQKARREEERMAKLMFHELNHQITTPLKIALDTAEKFRREAGNDASFDVMRAAEDTVANMRRVHRISRRTDLFQALHLDFALPERNKRKLSGLVIAEIVKLAVHDTDQLGENDPDVPVVAHNPAKDDLTGAWHATEADPDILDQILFNLLENAVKYSRANTRIEVKIGQSSSKRPFIRVSNEGEPITLPVNQLVARGVRDPSVYLRISDGAGLGLWIVDQVMKRLGGELKIEPARGNERRHKFTLLFRKG